MIDMPPDVATDRVNRLTRDYGFREERKSNGTTWLRKGVCPSRGKKELYTRQDAPWVIRQCTGGQAALKYAALSYGYVAGGR